MDVMEAIEKRRSVRAYQNKPIPEDTLKKILQAARLAPSANNQQAYKFIVVKDAQLRGELAKVAGNQSFIGEASVVIVPVSFDPDYVMTCGVPAHHVDIAIAIDHITLAAVAEGLGTCWIGKFYQEQVKHILHIPEKYKVVVLLPLGYPTKGPRGKFRKSLDELTCYDMFTK